MKQGGYKYIAPLVGKKMTIGVNPQLYYEEQNIAFKHYAVEFYKFNKITGTVELEPEQLKYIESLPVVI